MSNYTKTILFNSYHCPEIMRQYHLELKYNSVNKNATTKNGYILGGVWGRSCIYFQGVSQIYVSKWWQLILGGLFDTGLCPRVVF